jgi:Trk K+ transport system NAD-binding subunit
MYFDSILFDQEASEQMIHLFLQGGSPWIGKSLGDLNLRERFKASVAGIRLEDGHYLYAPADDYILQEDEIVLAVVPVLSIPMVRQDCCPDNSAPPRTTHWQRLPTTRIIQRSDKSYSLREAEDAIKTMARHFIICGDGPVISNALDKLNPERPFAVISDDNTLTSEMLKRGFRVVHGNPADEDTLLRAGVDRALAIMVSMTNNANSVLTVLNSRTLNRHILITATASTDEMIPKLRRAGADRVVSPFQCGSICLAGNNPPGSQ